MEEKDIDQKAIRTYESDIANAIQNRQTSQVSMVLAAEEKKREEEKVVVVNNATEKPDHRGWGKNSIMILISLVFLGAGIWAVYYFYTISPLSVRQPTTPAATSQTTTISSIITPNAQKIIDTTNLSTDQVSAQISKQITTNLLSPGQILEIVLGEQASTTQNGKSSTTLVKVTAPQFISLMNLLPPNALTSSLTDTWMLGIYSSAGNASGTIATSSPFIILNTNFFQNAFAGMLSWESTMPSELSTLFNIPSDQWAGGSFHDKLIENKDVREYTDNVGNPLFLYSFIDNNTLVIAQTEESLIAIITQFESKSYVR